MVFIRYVDYNNNIYTLSQGELEYAALTKDEIAKGIYDSNNAVKSEVNEKSIMEILHKIDDIMRVSSTHLEKRAPMSSYLRFKVKSVDQSLIIAPSPQQQALESLFKSLLKE